MSKVVVSGGGNTLQTNLKHALRRALSLLKKRNFAVDVYIVTEREIKVLNRKLRGRNKPTNVLSFKEPIYFPHPERKERFLGEIYLAPSFLKKKKEDITPLAIHGLLHLLGYTHSRSRDTIRMSNLENKLLRRIKK